ncbi:MAG: 4a-hydroxytetrahydrobiopterin dehydratase [Patescibacteria group bacterium]
MKCKPCEGGVDPFTPEQAAIYLKAVSGWSIAPDGLSISKKYRFKNFKEALAFVDRVGELAEEEGHHPDINLGWGRAEMTLSTHAIRGLSENDFILAYKIDARALHA